MLYSSTTLSCLFMICTNTREQDIKASLADDPFFVKEVFKKPLFKRKVFLDSFADFKIASARSLGKVCL